MKKRNHLFAVLITGICISSLSLISCKKNNGNSENAMPRAALSVDTLRGDITTVFHFDASNSSDKEDPSASLQVAWNFGDNGAGYSGFSSVKTITHSYTNTGEYEVKLVVKDSQGLADTTSQKIVIVFNLANNPPGKPVYTAPDNFTSFLPPSVKLTWLCNDPENDPLTFDIFIGTDPSVLFRISSGITLNEYTVTSMEKGRNYFWQIAARDPNGNYVRGDVWRFSTEP